MLILSRKEGPDFDQIMTSWDNGIISYRNYIYIYTCTHKILLLEYLTVFCLINIILVSHNGFNNYG
jgi:hypothetical protein